MKKTILSMILAVIAVGVNAQTLYGYYTNRADKSKTRYRVEYIMNGLKNKPSVLIEVMGEADKNYLMIDIDNIKSAQDGFKEMKEKYIEWIKVARENNVTEVDKRMDYPFHGGIGAAWRNSQWWFSTGFCWNMQPYFKIKGINKTVTFAQSVRSDSNEYIENMICIKFTSVQDFDSLINILDDGKLGAKIRGIKSKENLFK